MDHFHVHVRDHLPIRPSLRALARDQPEVWLTMFFMTLHLRYQIATSGQAAKFYYSLGCEVVGVYDKYLAR